MSISQINNWDLNQVFFSYLRGNIHSNLFCNHWSPKFDDPDYRYWRETSINVLRLDYYITPSHIRKSVIASVEESDFILLQFNYRSVKIAEDYYYDHVPIGHPDSFSITLKKIKEFLI